MSFGLRGATPDANDGMGGFCLRRTVLDSLLANAAAEAGVEVREGFHVGDLLVSDDVVVGVRGQGKDGRLVEEHARVVIGADGVNSFVARAVRAPEHDVRPVAACGYYSYFSGVRQDDIERYVRADIEGHVWRALESAPDFAARVRAGCREDTWHGTAGVPGYFRKPYAKGWALVGDASYNRDPITAQGISDAFIEAEMLATDPGTVWSGGNTLETPWTAHENARNERVRLMYEFTGQLAALTPPPPGRRALVGALHGNTAARAWRSHVTSVLRMT